MDELNQTVPEYRRQADELVDLLSSRSAAVAWTPANGGWSILEITAHLADAELLASARIRRVITQDRPELYGYQQELWAQSLAYNRQKIDTVSARFTMLRRENAELLGMIDDEIWRQTGRHDEYGELSLRDLIGDYITHTTKHLDQIAAVMAEYEASNNKPQLLIASLRGTEMTKTKDKSPHLKETKDRDLKGKSNLVGRVKKVIKKSRRKLGEEKFEKELRRTIEFLAQLQVKLDNSQDGNEGDKVLEKVEKKAAGRAGKKVEKKIARNARKAKPGKKNMKTAGNGAGKKSKAAHAKDTAPAAESVITLQAEAPSTEQQAGD